MHDAGKGRMGASAKPDEGGSGWSDRFNLDPTFLPAALDEEESARIDYDSDKQQTLIIVDIPYGDTEGTGSVYSTIPLGIVL